MSIKPWEAGYVLMIEPNAVSDALRLCRDEIERLRKAQGDPVAYLKISNISGERTLSFSDECMSQKLVPLYSMLAAAPKHGERQ